MRDVTEADVLRSVAEITLPLPSRVIHPNGRTRRHGYRAALVRKARGEACFVGRMHPDRPLLPFDLLTVRATFYVARRHDGDNLNAWIKPYLDGLADAGWVVNDRRLTLLPPEQVVGKDRKCVLEVMA